MTPPELSIIISTIGAPEIEKVVSTFLASSVPLEVVVVLDKPDLHPDSIFSTETINDPRLKIIINECNLGATRSFNKAIAASMGAIMVRADDDDIPAPNRLDEILHFFQEHPNVDIVYSYATGVDKATGRSWRIEGPQQDVDIKAKLPRKNFIVHASLAFRRGKLAQIGFYDETFRFAQDYDLYLRAIRAGFTFGCIPKVLVTRYYHPDSITVKRRKRQILNSMAARLLHCALSEKRENPWPIIARYCKLLLIPNWARKLKRKIGFGT
ncbi:MAG: glycosyltransferase [Alphaproteobacteria bacterium]